MKKILLDFEDKVILTSRVERFKIRLKDIYNKTTKLLQRRDIPETAKDEIREIRKIADRDDEE